MPNRKFSRQRESILENLKSRVDHPTADMVYSDIRLIYPNISLGTVYRNLSVLSEENEIQKIVTEDGVLRYDYNIEPHDHFVCTKCKCVTDMSYQINNMVIEETQKLFDGSIEKCDIIFYGLCKNCKPKTH